MERKLVKGIAAGAIIGAAAGMLLMPGMDRKTRKRLAKAGRRISGFAGDLWDGIKDFTR